MGRPKLAQDAADLARRIAESAKHYRVRCDFPGGTSATVAEGPDPERLGMIVRWESARRPQLKFYLVSPQGAVQAIYTAGKWAGSK